jgi:two-component system phosphate regulon sensor histidine kinase PhoR
LLHNACKFTPNGGRISVSAQQHDDDVTVSVTDTGPGIPPEDLPRIFERFYKVDRARGQSGTGLGLAIARHIVEGHGGRIWAESSLGHGATFRFTLPMC